MAAKGATLTFMVGGPEDKFLKAKELLSLMGKNVVHCGEVSTGQVSYCSLYISSYAHDNLVTV